MNNDDQNLPTGGESPASQCYAPQPWIAQPTRAGWWWWTGHDEPLEVEAMTNGRREELGLGVVLPKVGIKLCANLPGRWSGPFDRPALPDAETGHNASISDRHE